MKAAASSFVLGLCLAIRAQAEVLPCTQANAPTVVLNFSPEPVDAWQQEVARQLGAGLAASGVGVCIGDGPREKRVAQVDVDADPTRGASLRIVVRDDVTTKTLQRSVDLIAVPADSRAVAMALYIEELLQASWAELALERRVYLRAHPVATPPEVKRELDSVLPARESKRVERRLRVSVGGVVATFHGGLTQAGPELSLGLRVLPWLEPSLRVGYRMSPLARGPDGTIEAQTVIGGAFLDPFWQMTEVVSLRLPQGLDLSRVTFLAHPNPTPAVGGASGVRTAVVTSHGAGLRFTITPGISASATARFCWTLVPALAADDHHPVAGISGAGAEGELTIDAHF